MIVLGGADSGSRLVVGPQDERARPIIPMVHELADVHEIVGAGTLFPDEAGIPILHMHVAGGREEAQVTGCVRTGVKTWQVIEVILFELLNFRLAQAGAGPGFKLPDPGGMASFSLSESIHYPNYPPTEALSRRRT